MYYPPGRLIWCYSDGGHRLSNGPLLQQSRQQSVCRSGGRQNEVFHSTSPSVINLIFGPLGTGQDAPRVCVEHSGQRRACVPLGIYVHSCGLSIFPVSIEDPIPVQLLCALRTQKTVACSCVCAMMLYAALLKT